MWASTAWRGRSSPKFQQLKTILSERKDMKNVTVIFPQKYVIFGLELNLDTLMKMMWMQRFRRGSQSVNDQYLVGVALERLKKWAKLGWKGTFLWCQVYINHCFNNNSSNKYVMYSSCKQIHVDWNAVGFPTMKPSKVTYSPPFRDFKSSSRVLFVIVNIGDTLTEHLTSTRELHTHRGITCKRVTFRWNSPFCNQNRSSKWIV